MATVDNLTISIKANADAAAKNIQKLSTAVKYLKDVSNMPDGLRQMREDMDYVAHGANKIDETAKATKRQGEAAEKSAKQNKKWAMALGRVAFYRLVRTAIKEVEQAFTVGMERYKEFSELMQNDYWKTLTSINVSTERFKNQLGSMMGELVNLIAPVLTAIINVFTVAIDKVTQFFAALQGKTKYNKASDLTGEMANNLANADKSAKSLKATLLGFDEINRLNDNTDNGKFSDWGALYEETNIDTNILKVADVIRKVGESIDKYIVTPLTQLFFGKGEGSDSLENKVKTIGGILLGWTIGKTLFGDMGLLKNVLNTDVVGAFKNVGKTVRGVFGTVLTLKGGIDLAKDSINAWNDGVNIDTVKDMLVDTAELTGGLTIAFGKTGGAIGLIIGGLDDCVVGFKDWNDKGELTYDTSMLIQTGITEIATAISILTGNPIPLLIGAFADLALSVAPQFGKFCDEIIKAWYKVLDVFGIEHDTFVPWNQPQIDSYQEYVDSQRGGFSIGGKDVGFTPSWDPKNTGWIDEVLKNYPPVTDTEVDVTINASNGIGDIVKPGVVKGKTVVAHANGGFPEDGLFFANHGELVGQFSNGRTAVANNAEIIEGIKQGVYEAMAMAGNSSGNVNVYLDGKKIAEQVTRRQWQTQRALGV